MGVTRYKKIAIVYDWIDKWGGVERVLLTLHEMFPETEFYVSYYDPEKASWAKNLKIRTSFIQNLPKLIRGSRMASLPFYPYAFEAFNFSSYDLVISVTSSFAKSIITRPETLHICYLLTPTRYLWVSPDDYIKNRILRSFLSPYLTKLRNWDFIAAQRPDKIISISQTVAGRCKKYYQRESEVIFPPFDVDYWKNIKSQFPISPSTSSGSRAKSRDNFQTNFKFQITNSKKYYLVVSRLEPYKRVDLVIQLINLLVQSRQLNQQLIIVGEGSQLDKLRREAGENVTFLNKALRRYDVVKYELKHNSEKFGLKNVERYSKNKFAEKFSSFLK